MKKIKIKLDGGWYASLHSAYVKAIRQFECHSEHDHLLLEHAQDLCHTMGKKLLDDQTQYTISLTSVEALAYAQWWSVNQLDPSSLEFVTMSKVLGQIDQYSKAPKKQIGWR